MYHFNYQNEKEFRQLENGLRKINYTAFKKLMLRVYPDLKESNVSSARKIKEYHGIKLPNLYEIELPTDKMTKYVYSTNYKLIFQKEENTIKLIEIQPKEIILEHLKGNTLNYKGVIISKNDSKSRFKVDLLNMIQESDHFNY